MMVVRNEIKRIKECLDWHLPYVDEVVIVDQQSDDGTWEFLQDYFLGSKHDYQLLRDKQWGYCEPSKQMAFLALDSDWVFYVDADEKFPEPFLKDMHVLIQTDGCDGFIFPRDNIFNVRVFGENVPINPKILRVQHPSKDFQLRLTRSSCSTFPEHLHNRVRVLNKNGEKRLWKLPYPIEHIKDIEEQWGDEERYKRVNNKNV